MSEPIHIRVTGGGSEAPLCALMLAQLLPPSRAVISLRRTGASPRPGDMAVLPDDVRALHRLCKIKEAEFIRQTDATFNLGYDCHGFGPSPFLNVNANYGALIESSAFHLAQIATGAPRDLRNWEAATLPAQMIRQDRFSPPQAKAGGLLANYGYGYHVDAARYAEFLAAQCPPDQDPPADLTIQCDPAEGFAITSDCGFHAAESSEPAAPSLACTQLAGSDGVSLDIPLRSQTQRIAMSLADGAPLVQAEAAWTGDQLRLGPAAGRLMPIYALPARFLIASLNNLAALLPTGHDWDAEAAEFNRLTARLYDRLADFQNLSLALAGQPWSDDIALSEAAQHKRDLFAARGRMATLDDDDLLQDHYVPMFLGAGVWPKRLHPMAAALDPDHARGFTAQLEQTVTQITSQMPSQAEFLRRACGVELEVDAEHG